MDKKVRVQNNTTDGTSIRAYIVHLDPTTKLMVDVLSGQFVQNNHMTPGHRGVVVYDDFQEKVIATGDFILSTQNVRVSLSGDAASGYSLAFATFT